MHEVKLFQEHYDVLISQSICVGAGAQIHKPYDL